MPLKARLTLIAAAAVALVMAALIWIGLEAREEARERVAATELRRVEAIWREVLAATHFQLEVTLDRLASISGAGLLGALGPGDSLPEGQTLQVILQDGTLLRTVPNRPNAEVLLDATSLEQVFAGEATLRSLAQEGGRRVVALAARQWHGAESNLALAVSLDLEDALLRFARSMGGEAYLVNRRGALLGASDPALWPLAETVALSGPQQLSEVSRDGRTFAVMRMAVTGATGHPAAYLMSVREVTDQARAARLWRWIIISGSVALLAAAVIGLYLLVGRELRPLERTVQVLGALARGDLNQPIEARPRRDEVGEILTSLSSFRDSLILARTAERQKDKFLRRQSQLLSLQRELRVAADIQQSILPKTFPDRPGCSIAALMHPAKEVGGDFFDVFETRGSHIGFCVADVSDKGIPAALFMAVSRTLVHQEGLAGLPPAQVMSRTNDALAQDNPSVMFVTTLYGDLDPRGGLLRLANAGHNPPYILRRGSGLLPVTHRSGPALGVMEDLPFGEDDVQLQPGDLFFAFTDGVTEAFNPAGEAYTTERLEALLHDLVEAPVETVIKTVLQSVANFSAGEQQSDDITCLAIRWTGPET